MLKRLRLKNWRSIKETTIDFTTPITVFIGANASGKTNILDALRFWRDANTRGIESVVLGQGYIKIKNDALHNDEDVELDFTYRIDDESPLIREIVMLRFDKRSVPFQYGRKLFEGDVLLRDDPFEELPLRNVAKSRIFDGEEAQHLDAAIKLRKLIIPMMRRRWQILVENFYPPTRLTGHEGGDLYVIEPDARNVLLILNFMQQAHPSIFEELQNDFTWLLGHIKELEIWQHLETRELELLVREKTITRAPTISEGTARIIAMLTAMYALDMPQNDPTSFDAQTFTAATPGLVVIEEPDTALNPGLLRNFVERLRYFVTGEHPRQVILTTHNPQLLSHFEPEEVRIVERDENGHTTVKPVPPSVKEIWLDEFSLGEVWMTNSFGGLPE